MKKDYREIKEIVLLSLDLIYSEEAIKEIQNSPVGYSLYSMLVQTMIKNYMLENQ